MANFRPGFMVQVYSSGLLKSHFSAASGVGSVLPSGKLSRYW